MVQGHDVLSVDSKVLDLVSQVSHVDGDELSFAVLLAKIVDALGVMGDAESRVGVDGRHGNDRILQASETHQVIGRAPKTDAALLKRPKFIALLPVEFHCGSFELLRPVSVHVSRVHAVAFICSLLLVIGLHRLLRFLRLFIRGEGLRIEFSVQFP